MQVSPFRRKRRTVLTPGELYRAMSAEFRRLHDSRPDLCLMPMPVPKPAPAGSGPNWDLKPMGSLCWRCEARAAAIFRDFSERFDLMDFSTP
ncbi:MAG TPA: hypothetical protein VFK48_03645, partial [Usitatibacter sp.]|nr:hypothetical protein [Usitatibacter sp.]